MRPHRGDCPDATCIAGYHECCPCPHCMDTGYLSADISEISCDCGAALQTEEEADAEIVRLAAVGHLLHGRFSRHIAYSCVECRAVRCMCCEWTIVPDPADIKTAVRWCPNCRDAEAAARGVSVDSIPVRRVLTVAV